MTQILLVDDNATNLQVLYQTLDGHGYRLLAARSGKDALAIAARAVPDLILLDVMMPDMDGFETCARLKSEARTSGCAVIFLSAVTESREKARGLELGAVDFINKPFQAEEVLARVRTHLALRDLRQQLVRRNEELQHELRVAQELLREARDRSDGVLLGDSAIASRLRDDVDAAARSDEPLLISGPPGSDHEAVARAVHHQSARGARPIICVSCLAVAPGTTATGETGGHDDFEEKLRLARGGTLYFEGIQHLAPESQRQFAERITRALTTSAGRGPSDPASPVPSDSAESAARVPPDSAADARPDVRVIASTTRDVDEALASGRLLPELHRVFTRTLDLAPLRARVEDLSALAPHILRRQAEHAGRTVPIISEAALKRLMAHRWPGNLRELRNVLGAALAGTQGPVLEIGEQLLDGGMRVGPYSLIERLGSGGMGEIWLARHQLLARPAAVKIVRDSVPVGEEESTRQQRFTREAQATAELESPHTVRLFDFGTTETGSFYYVMERLRGMDLQRMVDRHGPLPPERAVFLLQQACLSLSEAHGLGLVHRDIKPANLFVCRLAHEYDFVKVLDFGVVSRRRGRHDPSASITVTGLVLGTPAFIAPELIAGGGTFDGRVDIYSLGCIAFWLLTGRRPFQGVDPVALLTQHSQLVPEPPSSLAEVAIPPELDALVLECLAKDPAARPRTADILWSRLQAIPLRRWDPHRARSWWELHEPELVSR